MKQKSKALLNNILLIFLALQPFFDIYMSIVGEKLDVFGMSIATIIRTTLIVTLFVIVAVYQIRNKKHVKLLYIAVAYLACVLIYVIAHHLNIAYSNGYYITQKLYSVLTEIMYVERLVIPALLLYTVIILKPNKDKLEKTILCVATIVSLVIIITNIFKCSFASYSKSAIQDSVISYNLFDWFKDSDIPYKESLSKGLFVSANQIGALLVVLLPITMYTMLSKKKWYMFVIYFLQIISMTLIGTRVASLGWILVSIAILLVYYIVCIIKKEKTLKLQQIFTIIVIMEAAFLLYMNSPAHNRDFIDSYQDMYEEEIEEIKQTGE